MYEWKVLNYYDKEKDERVIEIDAVETPGKFACDDGVGYRTGVSLHPKYMDISKVPLWKIVSQRKRWRPTTARVLYVRDVKFPLKWYLALPLFFIMYWVNFIWYRRGMKDRLHAIKLYYDYYIQKYQEFQYQYFIGDGNEERFMLRLKLILLGIVGSLLWFIFSAEPKIVQPTDVSSTKKTVLDIKSMFPENNETNKTKENKIELPIFIPPEEEGIKNKDELIKEAEMLANITENLRKQQQEVEDSRIKEEEAIMEADIAANLKETEEAMIADYNKTKQEEHKVITLTPHVPVIETAKKSKTVKAGSRTNTVKNHTGKASVKHHSSGTKHNVKNHHTHQHHGRQGKRPKHRTYQRYNSHVKHNPKVIDEFKKHYKNPTINQLFKLVK